MNIIPPEEAAKRFAKTKPSADKPAPPIEPIPAPVGAQAAEGADQNRADDSRNAPLPVASPAVGEFKMVTGGQLAAREDNPRGAINETAPKFVSLVESVKGPKGIITPLIVRPHTLIPDMYEVLAGHRRLKAGRVAELALFPVVVKQLTDREALEVMALENFDREDLTPLEEARSVRMLLDSGHGADEIASRTGKTRQWIARRANLLNLSKDWQEWAEERGVSAAHLELIARYPKERQAGLLERLEDSYDFDRLFTGPNSVKALAAEIADEMKDLLLAPWNLDDTVLDAKAGACAVCPKRSGCQPDLFADEAEGGDRCLDPDCWEGKMEVFKEKREAALRVEHPGLVKVVGKNGSAWTGSKRIAGVMEEWEYKKAGKKTAGAVPALVISGDGEGTLIYVTAAQGGGHKKVATAAAKQAEVSQDPKACEDLLKEKRKGLEQRRLAWTIQKLLALLEECELPAAPEFATAEGVLALVAAFGVQNDALYALDMCIGEQWKIKPGGIEHRKAVWEEVKPKIRQQMFYRIAGDIGDRHEEGCKFISHLLGVNLQALWDEAEKEIPEPKSWNALRKLTEAPAKGKPKKEQRLNKAGLPVVREVNDYKCDKCGADLYTEPGQGDREACLLGPGEMLCTHHGGKWKHMAEVFPSFGTDKPKKARRPVEGVTVTPEAKAIGKALAKKQKRGGKMAAAGDDSDEGETWTPEGEPTEGRQASKPAEPTSQKTNKAAGKRKGRAA